MKRHDPDMGGADADEGQKFDSADVEAERRSDAIFETLDVYQRFEIVRAGVVRLADDEEAWSPEVCACLERRCRAWYAARGGVEK
jgi:hypothetical protein